MKTTFNLLALLFLIGNSTKVVCHGDLDLRIKAASEEIANQPDSAFLYFKRGKLYFQHEEYSNAVGDIELAGKLGYHDAYMIMMKAQCFLQLDSLNKALEVITPIEKNNPHLALPYKIKGRIYFQMGKYESSARAWEQSIKNSKRKTPEDYIAASNAWFAGGNNDEYINGLSILDEGLLYFNNVQSLLIHKRDSAKSFLDFNTAISCQLRIIDQSRRKEFQYFELGEIYEEAGLIGLALEQYSKSKNALNKLPSHIQSNKSIRLLEDALFQKLNQVKN